MSQLAQNGEGVGLDPLADQAFAFEQVERHPPAFEGLAGGREAHEVA